MSEIVAELRRNIEQVSAREFEEAAERLCAHRRVFITGEGRTGLIAAAFATRLAQLGWTAFMVGESTAPALRSGDLLIACTGSGSTEAVCRRLETARGIGAETFCVVGKADSPAAELAGAVLALPTGESAQLGRSAFEQALLIALDGLALSAAQKKGVDPDAVWENHANL